MKKKMIAVLLTLAMAGSMAACGGGSGSESKGSDSKKAEGERVVELWTCWTDGADTAKAGEEQIDRKSVV